LQLAMVIVYYSLHHHQDDDPSVDSTDSHHPQASLNATASQVVSLIMTRALQVEEGDSDGDSRKPTNSCNHHGIEITILVQLLQTSQLCQTLIYYLYYYLLLLLLLQRKLQGRTAWNEDKGCVCSNCFSSSDDRALKIIVFEALLVLRAVLFPRNIFLISGLASKRRKLKIALRRCILGDYNVDLSP
jgi:hypothetical protein